MHKKEWLEKQLVKIAAKIKGLDEYAFKTTKEYFKAYDAYDAGQLPDDTTIVVLGDKLEKIDNVISLLRFRKHLYEHMLGTLSINPTIIF